MSIGCGLESKFLHVGFGLLIFGHKEDIAFFQCHVGVLLGTHHLIRTDRAITRITTLGNVQEWSGIHVKLVNGSEGKDV